MNIAVICVGYTGNISGIALLAEYFATVGGDLFIHVDKKVNISQYESLPVRFPNLRLLEDRYEYFWGGFNGCLAVVSALKFLMSCGNYQRFVYLTEDSAPLISSQMLREKLSEKIEYIDAFEASEAWVRRRYEGYFYYDAPQINPRLMDERFKEVTDEFLNGIERLVSLRRRGKVHLANIYHGPAYFALSRLAVLELLESVQRDEHMRSSFEFSAIPEEQYFHTLLGVSPFRHIFKPFMLMEMSGQPAPMVYRTTAELEERSSWGQLFIRKVDADLPQIEAFVKCLMR